ncbi:MAG: hypothetical protein B1H08_00190 [Candidatus Omnitrophica bacterium 4484_171]|nr:MAG: hypothetical protein B1H08_00190 [Candidatus Omnitrophica bacterium 4484_171]
MVYHFINKYRKGNKAFTLIEIITVVAIIGITSALFYVTFLLNWAGFYNQISRVNLWQDANDIIDDVSSCGKLARSAAVSSNHKVLTLNLPDGTSSVYSIISGSPYGWLQKAAGGTTKILSKNIGYTDSSFDATTYSFIINLALKDKVFNRNIDVKTSTEICFRNQ